MSSKKLVLTQTERLQFAKALYVFRIKHPAVEWTESFVEAMKVLPADRRLSEFKNHPCKLPWLQPLLDEFHKNFGFISPSLEEDNSGPLSSAERMIFALKIHELRKMQPPTIWKECFAQANSLIPASKKMSSGVDHPNKISWLSPLLEDIEKHPKKYTFAKMRELEQPASKPEKQPHSRVGTRKLNDEERIAFAKSVHEIRKVNPEKSWKFIIQEANSALPEELRFNPKMNSLAQIAWLKPLLEKLENKVVEKPVHKLPGGSRLDAEDRIEFAKAVHESRKSHPKESWKHHMQTANKALPYEKRFPDSLNHPGQIVWIKPLLEKLEKEYGPRLVIDHRHTNAVPAATPAPAPEAPHIKVVPEGQSGKKEKSGAKIYLKADEKMLFAEAAYRARITNLGWSWHQCLIEANKSLPEYRQFAKLPASPSQMLWLPPLLEEISKRPLSSPDKIVPEPEAGYEIIPEVPVVLAPAPAVDMQAMIANAIATAVQQQVQALMGGVNLASAVTNSIPSENGAKVGEKKPDTRKKVIVVGLLPVQTNEVQKEFGAFYDLRFFHSNTPVPQIRESMKKVDFAVMMTNFVSHSTQTAMRSHPGFIYCNGNSTALKMKLREKLETR